MLESIRPALVVARRELIDQMRDWRIMAPIAILTLIFPAIMNFAADRMVGFANRYGAGIVADRLIPFLLMVVGFFPISVSLVIALESFAGEKERGSIEPLLTSPLKDWHLYLGKLAAVMIPPLVAAYVGIAVYLVGVYRELGWTAEPSLLIQIIVLTFVQALVMVSGAVVVSTQTTSVRAANLLASFIIIPMAFLMQAESMVMFWGEYDALWWTVLGLVFIAALLVRTGIGHFNREELLGRELDVLNLRWMKDVFVDQFRGQARGVGGWYRTQLWKTLREARTGLLLMALMFVGAFGVGAYLTQMFPIPPGLLRVDNLRLEGLEGFEEIDLFSVKGIPVIWFQNMRAIVLGTLLGLFSYGVLGILLVLTPFVIIGYFGVVLAGSGLPLWEFFAAFVLPHGIFEIPAILLAGSAILRMGARLAAPAFGESITEGVIRSFADWAKIVFGSVIPLLLAAAAMESLVTPRVALWLLTR
ncbi:MAG: stage II sporulation protein M [Chloroflexi bacterium]|nr:stage II sporulation protein M [Chloroflexota bacterium]